MELVVHADGPWLYQVKLGKELRFPNVTHHLRSPTGAVARLQIAPADAQFLDQSLPRLPGNDDTYRAVTLDMNGQIAIRARGEDQPQPTDLLLGQSERIGDPLRISTDRRYLTRALRLGFRELLFYAANAPIQCSDETRRYLWAVLEPNSALKPSAKAIRVASAGSEPSTTGVAHTKNRRRPDRSQGGATTPGKMDTELKPPADSSPSWSGTRESQSKIARAATGPAAATSLSRAANSAFPSLCAGQMISACTQPVCPR